MGFFIHGQAAWIFLAVLLLIPALLLRRGLVEKNARVVLRLGLEPGRSLYVVELAGRHLVLGSSAGGVSMLTELDAQAALRLSSPNPATAPISALRALLWKRA